MMMLSDLFFLSVAWWLVYLIRFETDLFPEPEPHLLPRYTIAPVGMNQVMWQKGVGDSYTDDPSQASVDFALTEPRFVYAIRLTYAYGDKTDGWADFGI